MRGLLGIGAAAGSRTRTSSVAGRYSAVKSQPRKLRGPGALVLPAPMPFQQRTNTSCYLAIPTHGFTVVLSVSWGTPPAKPSDCKIRPKSLGALCGDLRAKPTGGEPRLSRAFLCFVPGDIIKTSVCFFSQCFAFRCQVHFLNRLGTIRNPASVTVSRVGKFFGAFARFTCLPGASPDCNRPDVSGLRIDRG